MPAGTVTEFEWNQSTLYPGTSRKFWVYVPRQDDTREPASLMVFQDGEANLDPLGEVRATTVLDNLIHGGALPVTIGVFVNPGILDDVDPDGGRNKQRNVEYDAFDPTSRRCAGRGRLRLQTRPRRRRPPPEPRGVLLPDALRWLFRPAETRPADH